VTRPKKLQCSRERPQRRACPRSADRPRVCASDVHDLSRRVRVRNRGELTLLDAVSFTVSAGELVAIVGPSRCREDHAAGSGRRRRPGDLGHGALRRLRPAHQTLAAFRSVLGYVPRTTSSMPTCRSNACFATRHGFASRRRPVPRRSTMPSATRSTPWILTAHANVAGRLAQWRTAQARQQSRFELLTDPHGVLPRRADVRSRSRDERGADRPPAVPWPTTRATVVFTTHSVDDLAQCDRIVFMAQGGRVGFCRDQSTRRGRVVRRSVRSRSCTNTSPTETTAPTQASPPSRYPRPDVAPRNVIRRPVAGRVHPMACPHAPDARKHSCATP